MAWSRITEPGDMKVIELVARIGPEAALCTVMNRGGPLSERLLPRLELLDIEWELHVLERIGARVVIKGDEEWPEGLDDLDNPPHCLWVRGRRGLGEDCARSVSIVGARSATAYGEVTAGELAAGMCERSFTVISGAAFGIDAAAHRGALAVEGQTIAVLAGGVERAYPAAHASLINRTAEVGRVISEVAPGSAPTRLRFLRRNRLIATMSKGTVVVEAGLRSGSLSTANAAAEHQRVVAAVPGPVTSMVSAGCHQLIREGKAVLVTDAAEAVEAIGELGVDLAPRKRGPTRPGDGIGETQSAVLSALPTRKAVPVSDLVVLTTLPVREVLSALGQLALLGLAVRIGDEWKKGGQAVQGL